MKRIGDLDVDSFYREVDNFRNGITEGFDKVGDRITKGLERIETTKEPLWAIPSEKRVVFYSITSFCGITVSLVTLCVKWNGWSPSALLAVFNEIGIGIFSSVIIVWFLFQSGDATMSWGKAIRDGVYRFGVARGEKKEQKRQSRFEQGLREQGVSEEKIQNARKFSDSSSKDR